MAEGCSKLVRKHLDTVLKVGLQTYQRRGELEVLPGCTVGLEGEASRGRSLARGDTFTITAPAPANEAATSLTWVSQKRAKDVLLEDLMLFRRLFSTLQDIKSCHTPHKLSKLYKKVGSRPQN